jgi:amino acid transporter
MRGLYKRIFLIFCIMMLISNMVFASGSEQTVITNISNSILDIILWFGYAIMLGVMIFIGIKYVTSGANERANIKGMIPKFLIGAALIIMGFTIAKIVADIAGNDTAKEIIDVGANAETPDVVGGSN